MSQLFPLIRSIWRSAFGSFPSAEAFECHHDLVRLHPAATFKVDKRKRNDTFLIDDISRWCGPVPNPLFQSFVAACCRRRRASYWWQPVSKPVGPDNLRPLIVSQGVV
jgi:hypothetical protein